jgi:hypothetical protein
VIDDAAAEQTGRARYEYGHPASQILQSAIGPRGDRQAHVDNRNQIEIGEPIQEQASRVIVGAAEDDIARLQCVPTVRLTNPAANRHNARSERHISDFSGNDVDFRSHGVRITPLGSMEAVQVRDVDDVVVEESKLTDTESRQEHRSGAPSATATDNPYPESSQLRRELWAERKHLTIKCLGIVAACLLLTVESQVLSHYRDVNGNA